MVALADLNRSSRTQTQVPRAHLDDAQLSLSRLLESCATGDRHAFRQVYDITSRRVFGIVLSIVKDKGIAEEVAQEIYVRLWRRLAQHGAPHKNPSAWIAAMARNKAIDRLRSDRVRGFVGFTDDVPDIADDGPDAVERIDAMAVRRALSALRPEYRKVLLLSYFRGYTQSEMSEILETPVGTVKSWMTRGVEELRNALEQ